MRPGYLTPHFSRMEMEASDTAVRFGFNNVIPKDLEDNVFRLCAGFLEPIRSRFGPVRVTSGYRCPALNAAVKGSPRSAHQYGRAADIQFHDSSVALADVVSWVSRSRLPFDQCILELGTWIHLGIAPVGVEPRRETLVYQGAQYTPFTR